MPITAEGIEEQQLVDKLRELGCTKGQGWFYGQPLSVENVRQLLAERNLLISRKSSNLAEKQDVQAGLPYGSTGERAAG